MSREMEDGREALRRGGGVASAATVEANAGGPYGSAQLAGVQTAAEALWPRILSAVRALAVLNQLDERILLHVRHIENERLAAAIVAAA